MVMFNEPINRWILGSTILRHPHKINHLEDMEHGDVAGPNITMMRPQCSAGQRRWGSSNHPCRYRSVQSVDDWLRDVGTAQNQKSTAFGGMNMHLPTAIFWIHQGTRVLTQPHIFEKSEFPVFPFAPSEPCVLPDFFAAWRSPGASLGRCEGHHLVVFWSELKSFNAAKFAEGALAAKDQHAGEGIKKGRRQAVGQDNLASTVASLPIAGSLDVPRKQRRRLRWPFELKVMRKSPGRGNFRSLSSFCYLGYLGQL